VLPACPEQVRGLRHVIAFRIKLRFIDCYLMMVSVGTRCSVGLAGDNHFAAAVVSRHDDVAAPVVRA